MLKKRKQK